MKKQEDIKKMYDDMGRDYLKYDYQTVEFDPEFIEGFRKALFFCVRHSSEKQIKEFYEKTVKKLLAIDNIKTKGRKELMGKKNGYAFCLNYER